MKLALCVITKGDEELDGLKRLTSNLDGIFSGIFITTNHTYEKTKQWCEDNNYHHSHLDWCDSFSQQRNFNFSQVPKEYTYIVWADSDDIIKNPQELISIAKRAYEQHIDTVFFDYWYGCKFDGQPSLETLKEVELAQNRERLIRPGSIVWKKRLHESPVPIDGEHYTYTTIPYSEEHPVVWIHCGASRDESALLSNNRMERNKRMLEMDLADEERNGTGHDPRTLLYLMKIYAEYDDEETLLKCLSFGGEYLEKSGWDQERAVCLRLMSTCYGKLNRHDKARDVLLKAIDAYPKDPLLYLYLSRVYFNMQNFSAMKHWLEVALSINDLPKTNMANILELKILSTQLMLQYYFHSPEKNARKAYKAAKQLYELDPQLPHKETMDFMHDLSDLDEAAENTHRLLLYLVDHNQEKVIEDIYNALPENIKTLPFAHSMYNKFKTPRYWKDNEVCFYANFNGPHFEPWSPLSLAKGVGGSETAVIELSRLWVQMGYTVTVYGDPGQAKGYHDGVLYLPWFMFNIRDRFSTFIAWRHCHLVNRIHAKRYIVDLHDMYVQDTYLAHIDAIDKLMVKSAYHASLSPDIPDFKKEVISNGI